LANSLRHWVFLVSVLLFDGWVLYALVKLSECRLDCENLF